MASNWNLCGVCENRLITNSSVVWCSDCNEGLCGDCEKHHSNFKKTKRHQTVSIAEYKKLPTDIMKIAQVCKIHNKKFDLFCRKHDCPCCKKCAKVHSECKGLTNINELIKNVKTSNAFYEIEQTILEVFENIKRISTSREVNYTYLKSKKREIEAEIKQIRTNVTRHLDNLQDNLIKELMTTEQTESSKIQTLLTSLKRKEKDIAKHQANFAEIKQYASDLQTFLSMKQIEKDIAIEEKFIQSLVKNNTTNYVNISCQIDQTVQEIATSMQTFGEISVISHPCDLSIQNRKDRKAQIMVAPPTGYIDKLTLTLQKRINTDLSNIRGCTMLPDGKMVFSCYAHDIIKVLKSDGSTDFEIDGIGDMFDVVFIGGESLVVTSSESEKINIIDLKKKELTKSIEVNSHNDGVTYSDGKLIYCARKKGLQMISLFDESVTNVVNAGLPLYAYVTTFGDKLFYTSKNSVNCCVYHGNILWTFHRRSVLKYPLGVSVDNDGNVFVVGYLTNNVVVISPDGKHHRQLLSSEDGLDNPTVLHYDTTTNKLLVPNDSNDNFLYEIDLV